MGDEVPTPNPDHRAFSMFLANLEDGALNDELTDKLKDLVATLCDAAQHRGGKPKGAINIDIAFSLDSGAFDIKARVKVTKPKEERRKSVMWATPGNNLMATNPRQANLPFTIVGSGQPGAVRTIDHGGGFRTA